MLTLKCFCGIVGDQILLSAMTYNAKYASEFEIVTTTTNPACDMSSSPWRISKYKPGASVICQVTASEPSGYAVVICEDDLPGFLPTVERLTLGQKITAQFVCVHNDRVLLSARFTGSSPSDRGPDQQGSPVPKRPSPTIGAGAVSLPPPEPDEDDTPSNA